MNTPFAISTPCEPCDERKIVSTLPHALEFSKHRKDRDAGAAKKKRTCIGTLGLPKPGTTIKQLPMRQNTKNTERSNPGKASSAVRDHDTEPAWLIGMPRAISRCDSPADSGTSLVTMRT